ncbi:spermidine/putrescine ABC transporter ATP-binding protein [Clostridium novyi B str. ATCC 27606]|uniref:Spermidine/putrescine ABC transporter ATP-binding protein n=2 Tax=Clostridium TaxID=1485 RepID=A0AA40M609_CLONO|nr:MULTISPECIES: ABC transporter ATP-binding protein [Clostridium]KEI12542.1 spermidine/putrescine ABC transporter ATP-binding protein [Clostridium novyi B str. NCTC 9691]KEI16399.1 spermidine/putrescine ABC transporter ATP-binding protein [Clostridium novyi B str. ATCC 27606]KEI18533.1 spermidine/putrescine ABC transporter ATP-binding protein [Clostridium haemolyticum NCTC 9693]KGN04556.1 spermidine/putrescine ABC transporter ATP-binding protein [Clostridium haemolyticum NCTC 8350]CAG7840154.
MKELKMSHIFLNYHTTKGETEALKDINFSVYHGDFISIVGPSGCGKSTVLNIIAGLLTPSKGEVLIDNKKLNESSLKIGYMLQKDHLFNWLTVLDNVFLGLKIQNTLTKENKEKVEKLLKNYNLWDFKNHFPSQLSGGMRQRVALIRTLAVNPSILLLDEPFSALDYQSRLKASDDIFKIIKQENKTAIMVTHDISEAISMSTKIVVFSKRPAIIKKEIPVDLSSKYNSPIKSREDSKFRVYFNDIWKEIDSNE